MKIIVSFALLLVVYTGGFCQQSVGVFEGTTDIGKPEIQGTTKYAPDRQVYRLEGGGYNVWFNRDEFQFAHTKLKGNFVLTANVKLLGEGFDPHRKIGWMIRATLDEDAAHASAVVHGDGLTVLQWRSLKGAFMRDPEDQVFAPKKSYAILQLERSGKDIIMRAAHDGEPLQVIGITSAVSFPDEVYAGLFICSHNAEKVERGEAWNVRIDQPVPDNYNPDREGYIGCRMEIMDVFEGTRRVIHESKGRFEAPNWMPDGKRLLFNQNGSLYTIPIEGGELTKINTGFADRNNNDHGISFDGKMLAISHHRSGLPGGGSTVYVLPLAGGTPKQVTEETPSYWHGWAPNNKEVVYVAQREGTGYDIYKKNINGGAEIRLTHNTGTHVDGPEYSPDGKYIYYNGNQSGTMQIWRMRPDGSGKEQLTFDEYNDWFPHISPDGKWIVFISFPADIPVDSHPSFKRVMLRLMPVSGGAPRVIAYLYGGQGTINVPSWSSDSKRIAFVSNSRKFEE
jgi:Periplasmic component of the Tol biopolymer transport system